MRSPSFTFVTPEPKRSTVPDMVLEMMVGYVSWKEGVEEEKRASAGVRGAVLICGWLVWVREGGSGMGWGGDGEEIGWCKREEKRHIREF